MVDGSVGVVIGTFGSAEWYKRGFDLAASKVAEGMHAIHVHGHTLAEARNAGALYLNTDYVVFLDADDDLDIDYCYAMESEIEPGVAYLLQPATRGRVDGVLDDYPLLIPRTNMYDRNYLVVGTAVDRACFIALNGFRDLPVLEDWDLFIRFLINGFQVKRVPTAVYIVNVHSNSRNSNSPVMRQTYARLRAEYAEYAGLLRSHVTI